MATEEIEISDLELIEELSPDNVLPIETTTKTFATTLKKIRDWLGIESAILKQVPRGVVFPFSGSTAPEGFLICDGSAINRTTYAELFQVIGTTYGAGDGSTTFNLPNLIDKFIQGSATVGTIKSAGLPNITGSAEVVSYTATKAGEWLKSGVFQRSVVWDYLNTISKNANGYNLNGQLSFNASDSSLIYGNSSTVQPPALTMLYCIKY